MSLERLQKLISRAGLMSRREAEKYIAAGRVTVNGKVVTEVGVKFDAQISKICVDGRELKFDNAKIYLLLNKPRGYVTTTKDDRGRKTVLDLIPISERIYPVGRLDLNSEGLLLLTNDGELMNALLHPKFKVAKTYRVVATGEITAEKLNQLRAGVELEDGLTASAEINLICAEGNSSTLEITIREGRNRQVRRMLAAVGCKVKRLTRIGFASLTLSGLRVGEFRRLTDKEISQLRHQIH